MRRTLSLSVVVALGLVSATASCDSMSLRGSEQSIRESLLSEVALGSTFDQVAEYADTRGCRDKGYVEDKGFLRQEPGKPAVVVGSSSIRCHLGHYRTILRTDVEAFWAFDNQDQLIDVWIFKTTNAL